MYRCMYILSNKNTLTAHQQHREPSNIGISSCSHHQPSQPYWRVHQGFVALSSSWFPSANVSKHGRTCYDQRPESVYFFTYLTVYLSTYKVSAHLFISLYVSMYIYSMYIYIHLHIYLYACIIFIQRMYTSSPPYGSEAHAEPSVSLPCSDGEGGAERGEALRPALNRPVAKVAMVGKVAMITLSSPRLRTWTW